MAIKGKALSNFKAEFTCSNTTEVARTADNAKAMKVAEAHREKRYPLMNRDIEQWTLYVDRTSNDTGSGADIMLISPEGHKILCALRFGFKTLNNEAEYGALIAGLCLAKELQARNIQILATPSWS